jgi:DNA polymerase-3 subunit gamma/tau
MSSINLIDTYSEEKAPYRVLARKYRPRFFKDLIGQDVLVSVMQQAITSGRIPHAMILTGVRGVGKTTSARIIARALNCTGYDGAGSEAIEPCGVCQPCLSILEDRFVDVIEMDAATRTGVDDVRSIIETSQYRPVQGRCKVFIIDEVHMLSKNAFNALLKTLEEPPLHVKFIFATTEIRKVPDTVLSRCVRFDLRRLREEDILALYRKVLGQELIDSEDQALVLLAKKADGSARDALSLLDQAINLSPEKITEDAVRKMLHMNDGCEIIELFRNIIDAEMVKILDAPRLSYEKGSDPVSLLEDLAAFCHELSRLHVDANYDLSSYQEHERNLMKELAKELSIPILSRLWQGLLKGIEETENHSQPLRCAEMVLLRLTHLSLLPTPHEAIKILQDNPVEKTFSTNRESPSLSIDVKHQMVDSNKTDALMPKTFMELVNLFGHKKEMILQSILRHDVHLVDYKPGILRVRLSEKAPKDFVPTIKKLLLEWTANEWQIICDDSGGGETIKQQQDNKRLELESQIKDDPLYKEAIAIFPQARLESVEIGDNT